MIDELIEVDTRSLRGSGVIDEILPELTKQVRGLRRRKFDIAIDFQGLIKSAAIAKLSGAKRRWGFDKQNLREPAGRFLLTDRVAIPPMTHVIRKNLILAGAALSLPDEIEVIDFPIAASEAERSAAAQLAERAGGRYAILNPAGGWVTKLWHAEKYGQLADMIRAKLGLVPIVVTGPAESDLAARVMANTASGATLAATPGIKEFYALAAGAEVYIGGDTGPTHIAAAAGAPIVGIFGPTEWWRNGSLNPLDICVGREDISCRIDCHRRTCSKWICMDISVEQVFDAVRKRVGAD
jgi:ADP-heptose:LPS heptosyltransferase